MSKEKKVTGAELDECPARKHTGKSWIMALILGVFIGLAVIVPGVSGSTIAIIFGLYTGMLYAFGHIVGDFKRCFAFLLPIGIGVVVGFVAGFLVIQKVFELYLFQIICLFVGLMVGAVPALTKEIKGERATAPRAALFVLGFIIPIVISIVSIALSSGEETGASFTTFPVSRIFIYVPLGFLVSITQIVPGLSATAILMAFGQFKPILNSLHREYIFENPQVILLYGALGIGFLVGIVCVSRIFSAIIAKHKTSAFFMIIGLAFGSIASMFLNSDMYALYMTWADSGVPVMTVVIAAVLLLVGFVCSFFLTKYELTELD